MKSPFDTTPHGLEQSEVHPLLITIDHESIRTSKGSLTQLGLLLTAIGCTFTEKSRHGTHDHRNIQTDIVQIANHEGLLDDLVIKMIDAYRDFAHGTPEQKVHGREQLGGYFLRYGHPEDFGPNGQAIQALSVGDISEEMGLHAIIRGGRNKEFVGNKATYEMQQLMNRKRELIQALGHTMAQEIEQREIKKDLGTRERIINALRSRIGFAPQGREKKVNVPKMHFGTSVFEMTDVLKAKYDRRFTRGEPFADPEVINLWTRLKAIERRMNDLVGISTEKELRRIREEEAAKTEAYDRQRHPYKYRSVSGAPSDVN